MDKNYLNILFPYMINSIPINFILEPLYLYYFGLSGSIFAYLFTYFCYAAIILSITFAYTFTSNQLIIELPFSKIRLPGLGFSFAIFLMGVLVYAPVLIEFREFIFDPREIYIRTRTGYGLYFFISSFLSIVSFIVFLFSKRTKPWVFILFFLANTIFLFLHGSKGQVLTLLMITAIYFSYVKGIRIRLGKFALITGISATLIIGLFLLTTSYQYDNVLKLMVGYSDYNRNGMMVMDNQKEFYYGRLTFESNFFSRIPRAILPNKPKDYGMFKLASIYFPLWFDADTGSPAFGLGVQYADFGYFAIFYLSIWGLATGWLMKAFMNRLKTFKTPGDFIMVVFLAGIVLIPLGDGYLLPEHLIIAFLINVLLCIKFKGNGSFVR